MEIKYNIPKIILKLKKKKIIFNYFPEYLSYLFTCNNLIW